MLFLVMPSASRRKRSPSSAGSLATRRSSRARCVSPRRTGLEPTCWRLSSPEFGRQHPKVCVELLTDARLYSLPRREADMPFRITPFREAEVISRRLLRIPYALYGAKGSKPPSRGDGAGLRIVTMDESSADMPDAVW